VQFESEELTHRAFISVSYTLEKLYEFVFFDSCRHEFIELTLKIR